MSSGTLVNDPTPRHLYAQARAAAYAGLGLNVLLAAVKLTAGLLGHSMAMLADAFNSVGDGLTSIVILYALRVAEQPADAEHPYGHSRAEAIAALSVSVFVFSGALFVAIEALGQLFSLHPPPPLYVLWIAAANVVLKEGMYHYKRWMARQTGSHALMALAWDHRSDALCSGAVLVGLLAVRYGGPSLIWADEAAALLVVILIVYASYKLFSENASYLMDRQVDPQVQEAIAQWAAGVPEVRLVEKIRARGSGLEIFVDLHIEVPANLTVAEGHEVGHRVQNAILNGIPAVTQVLVHVEPEGNAARPPAGIPDR
jgi:cation diffusion facilitator family transporter